MDAGSRPVLVIGGAGVDLKLKSLARVEPGTSNPVARSESYGGVARNIAENLARLGLPVQLMTAVGTDPQGTALLRHAHDLGIDTSASLRVPTAPTGLYAAVLQPDGELLVGLAELAVIEWLSADAVAARTAELPRSGMLVFDLNLPTPTIAALLARGRGDRITAIAVAVSEPKMQRLPERLDGLTLLILNRGELAARLGRTLGDPAAILRGCVELRSHGVESVVVTMGAAGFVLAGPDAEPLLVPGQPCRAVDVTGAGDAFAAGVIAGLRVDPGGLRQACEAGAALARLTLASEHAVAPELTPAFFHELQPGTG